MPICTTSTKLPTKYTSSHTTLNEPALFEEHRIPVDHFLRKYQTTLEYGLRGEQADQNLTRYGLNILTTREKPSLFVAYLRELFGGFGTVLWVAALLCLLSWRPFGGSRPDIYNLIMAVLLLVVIFVQGTFTFVQQVNSNSLLESFQGMLPSMTRVRRDGQWTKIRSSQLVPGDVVQVQAGDKIPADMRVFECGTGARSEKSSITGESEGIQITTEATHANMLETRNLLFCGSSLLEGTALGVVYRTGKQTVLGGIAQLTMESEPEDIGTLQKELNYFISIVAVMAFITSTLILTIWYWVIRPSHPDFLNLPKVIVVCIISSVAFIPDGLPLAVTMTLTLVARAMYRNKILVKRLSVVETLGSATVIATDKTGTITQNRMSVSWTWMPHRNEEWDLLGARDALQLHEKTAADRKLLLLFAGLCSKAAVDGHSGNLVGNPTECALLRMLVQQGMGSMISRWQGEFPLLGEISFTSRTKYHITLHSISDTETNFFGNQYNRLLIIKGAPEVVLSKATVYQKDDQLHKVDEQFRTDCTVKTNERACRGERMLAFGYKVFKMNDDEQLSEDWETRYMGDGVIFFALVTLVDPPREGVRDAVRRCHEAGVRVMMVTGDHPGTALAIGRMVEIVTGEGPKNYDQLKHELGALLPQPSGNGTNRQQQQQSLPSTHDLQVEQPTWWSRLFPRMSRPDCTKFAGLEGDAALVLGSQLDALTQLEWDYLLSHGELIFARTTPQHKLAIVQQLQRRGEVVAVTGDGVNDAPALKMSDIGIAMGVEGSEVSKEAANMVLLDDNFVTIVSGIREGRLLFDNLKKVIAYLLSAGSFSEILPVMCHAFFGLPLPLSPIQMILICVGTDMLGAVSLAHELPESYIMRRRPRDPQRDRLVNFRVIFYSFFQVGMLEFLIALLVYFITMSYKDVVVYDLLFAYEKWDLEDKPFAGLTYPKRLEALSCAQTGFFLSLVILQMWNLVCARTRTQSMFKQSMRMSMWIVMALQLALALGICWIPWFNKHLRIGHPIWFQWAFPLVIGAFIWAYDEGRKFIVRRYPGSLVKQMAW